jgi:hypothetical protein
MTAGRRSHPAPPVGVRAVLAVAAHPDDESFGLGAVLPVLGWTIPQEVAEALNAEFGTGFIGRAGRRAGARAYDNERTIPWITA